MSTKNQLEVTFEGGFLKMVNVDGVNPTLVRLNDISQIYSEYYDVSAINAYSKGHNQFDYILLAKFLTGQESEDNIIGVIDINRVTNQPLWTKNKAGLDKAIMDLTLASGTGGLNYQLPQTDISAIGATEEIVIPFYTDDQWSIQFNWAGVDANTGTIDLLVSSDNVNFQPLANFTQIVMDPIPASSASVEKTGFPYNYLKILITKNTATVGTIDYFINK